MKNILRNSNFGFKNRIVSMALLRSEPRQLGRSFGGLCATRNALLATVLALGLGVAANSNAQVLWNFGTATPTSGVPTGVTIGAVTQGNNNGTTTLLNSTSASSGYTGASGGNNAGAAARIGFINTGASGSAFFEFTITPDANYSFTISGFSFGTRSTSTGPVSYSLRSSDDSYASDLATGSMATGSWVLKSNTGLNINRSVATTYRIYGYGGAGSASANTANWRIDDLTVSISATGAETTPNAPVVVSASAISTSGFTANWAASSGATKYFLDVATDNGFTSFVTGYQNKDVGNVTSSAVTSLNAGTTYYYRVRANNSAGTSADSQTQVVLTTSAAAPLITPSVASLTGLSYNVPGPSTAQSLTLSVANLTGFPGTVTISGSTNYEVSTTSSSTGFGPSATLSYSGGSTLDSSTVWVRLKAGLAAGSYNAEIIGISGGGATSSFTASGSVTVPALTLVLSTNSVAESAGANAAIGTVGISASLGTDLVVNLVSTNTAAATVPSTVTITNGQTNATFDIAAVADPLSSSNSTTLITASNIYYTAASSTLTVVNTNPVVTLSTNALSLYAASGVASASALYTVRASAIGSNSVVVTAPTNFEVSTNNATWVSSYSLASTNGDLPATTVYVRMSTTAPLGINSASVSHVAGSASASLAVTGVGLTQGGGAVELAPGGYTQNFDSIGTGLPTGWSTWVSATSSSLGTISPFASGPSLWTSSGGGFKNYASFNAASTDGGVTTSDRALGVRQVGSGGFDPGAGFSVKLANTLGKSNINLSFKAMLLDVQTRSTTWTVQYGIGEAPTSFTSLTTFVDPGILGSTTINIPNIAALNNVNTPVWIRIAALSATTGSGSRDTFAIDDFSLTYDVSSAVTISSFVASSGPVGTQVTINGANFTSGMPVKFNGIDSQLVSFVSASQLVATVPEGATTGYITVGEAAGAVESATAFVVGDFAVTTPLDGMDFGSVSVGGTGVDKNLVIMGGGLPEGTLNIESDSPDFLLSEDGSAWSSSLSIAYDGSFATPYIRFAPLSTGAKTGVVTLSSGGITVAKYTFTGTGNSIQNVTGFAAVSGNAQIGLSWTNASPSTKVIILAQQGSAVTDSPVATNSYTASTVYGSGTQVGTSFVVFNSTGTNVTVTGLTNRLLYYFKAFNVSGDNVSSGTSVSRIPYVALSNVITQWNFNGSSTTPSSGTGTAQATGGTIIKTTYATGSPTDSLGAGGVGNVAWTLESWTGGSTETAGVQFNVSTAGRGNIVISWDALPSNTGPKYYRLLYTTDASVVSPVWVAYNATGSGTESGLYVNPVGGSWTIQNQADLSGVPALQNNPNAAFRLVSAYAPGTSAYAAAQSGSTAGSGGTLRLDMVTVSGVEGEFNSAPTNITLSATAIAENNAVNTVVGTFSTTDVDSGDTFTYSLVAGDKDIDNAFFNISGNSLRASARFDFETKSSYSIRVRTTDSANNTFENVFRIFVEDLPEALTYSSWLGALTPSDAAFLDYVFGAVTPGTLDPSLKPTVAVTGGDLVLTYYVRQGTAGLTVTPKTSADLAAGPSGWVTDGVTDIAVGTPITVNSVSVQQRTASVPVSGAKKFLRVEAVQQ